MMHWGNFSGMEYGGFGFGWIFMILIWALVFLGIVYLVKQLFSSRTISTGMETAEEILRKKYASGEITRDEYYEKRAVMRKKY